MAQANQNIRTFYTLILTQTFSLIGSRISGLAIGIWVFNQTGNATPLALVAFFATLPAVIASSVSGVLADRWDRRIVMVVADAGQAVGTAVLLVTFMAGSFELWHLYVITFIQAIFSVFQGPAFQASVTMLIPDEQRDRANAIQQLTGPMAGIFAPVIAGFVFAAAGVTGAILIDLATFLVAVAVIFSINIPRPEATAEGLAMKGTFWKEIWSGLRYLWSKQTLFAVMIYISFLNFLVSAAMTLSTPYILARTGSETTLGILLSVTNVGAIVGGVIIGVWGGTRPRMYTIMPAIVVAGAGLALVGIDQSAVTIGVALFMFMLPLPIVNALFMSMMQAKIPPDIQGRVFAVLGQMSMLLMPLAHLMVGPLADQVFEPAVSQPGWEVVAPLVGSSAGSGMGMIILLGGALTVLISLVTFSFASVRNLEATMPDYVPVAADETTETLDELATSPVASTT